MDPFAPETLGTNAHLDALDALRARGDVVELPSVRAGTRRTFVALGHAVVAEAARHPSLSSSWGTGGTDLPEAGDQGVPFRAVHMSTGAVHASLRAALAPIVGVDASLGERARAACTLRGTSPGASHGTLRGPLRGTLGADEHGDVDALAFAMHVQRAALGPRFDVDNDTLARNIALVHRAAFAEHDDPARAHIVTREVDAALVAGATSDHAWLMRFAWLTAFVTTELAIVHMLEALADFALLRRVREDVDVRARFVDESLRVQSPVARFGRVAVDDVVLAGHAIPRGARVLLSFVAANHDARVFPSPRLIDLDRARPRSAINLDRASTFERATELDRATALDRARALDRATALDRAPALERARAPSFAFGAGEHACAGAPVALAILRAVVDALVDDARIERIEVIARTPLRSHVNRGARVCTVRMMSRH